jgi:hypothetical protein
MFSAALTYFYSEQSTVFILFFGKIMSAGTDFHENEQVAISNIIPTSTILA